MSTQTPSTPVAERRAGSPAGGLTTQTGRVAFVGAGPGDPALLTVRAVDLLRSAEVIVTETPEHTVLVHRVLGLDLPQQPASRAQGTASSDGSGELKAGAVRAAAGAETPVHPDCPELVDGGFGNDGAPLTHAGRSKIVVRAAKGGRRVVRLMSGDPFAFASGPEEAVAAVKAGLEIEIVPGVPVMSSVAAYAGIPLTTRRHREIAVVSCSEARIDWTRYADDRTLVLLSAVGSIGTVCTSLIAAGRAPATPAAMVSQGSTTEQRSVVSTLAGLEAAVADAELVAPAVAVIGEVVAMRETLSWFETRPMFGWRVLVPRTKEQAGSMSASLRAHGAVPEEVPTISVEAPRNPQQMDKAVRGLVEGRYEWIAFTSVNAVRAVREKFEEYGLDARAFSGLKIAAVGEKTAATLEAWGLRADLVPTGEQSARGLVQDWPEFDSDLDPINRVFLPRADIATETLVAGLIDLGWEVDDVTAYRTVRASPPPAPVRDAIKGGRFDAVVFTSSSTVRNLVGIAGKPHPATVVAVIGPATAKTAEEHGLRVDVLAPEPSVEALVEALAEFGAARRTDLVTQGLTVTRPSESRTAGRRRAGSK